MKSKDRLKEVRENILGDEAIRMGRKYLKFPNSCLVKGLVKIGCNIFTGWNTDFRNKLGSCSYMYLNTGTAHDLYGVSSSQDFLI